MKKQLQTRGDMSKIVKLEPKKKIKLKKYALNITLDDGFKCKMTLREEMTTGLNFISGSLCISPNNPFDYMKFSDDLRKNNYVEIPDDVYVEVDTKKYDITENHVVKIIHSNDFLKCDDGVVLNLQIIKRFKYDLALTGTYEKEIDFYTIYTKEETK